MMSLLMMKQTVKQLEVIQQVILSEVSKLNELIMNKTYEIN